MSRRSDGMRLQHMLDHAREAMSLVEGRRRTDLGHERVLCLALVRRLEVVGEAAGRVSTECIQRHSAIPWAQIVGLRNRLIHGYDAVDLDVLWESWPPTCRHWLPTWSGRLPKSRDTGFGRPCRRGPE